MATSKDSIDSSIVSDFEKLRVLASYDFPIMEDMAQDLSNALEESTKAPKSKDKINSLKQRVKRKCKKRKASAVTSAAGNMSEASESSLDEALKDYMETMANHSDSDDLRQMVKIHNLLQFTSQSISLAESDSFTENFSPMRPGRRRRRFKRMAVDAKPDSEICITDYMREQRLKRLSAGKLKTKTSQQEGESMSVDSKEWTRGDATGAFPEATLGKRKRGMKAGGSLDLLDDDSGQSQCKLENMDNTSSSLSSSSDSDFFFTNDEGQEGDDEHSDFFHEAGELAGGSSWWEEQDGGRLSGYPSVEAIFKGSFNHMSEDAKCNFKARLNLLSRPGREIRMGRRRLPHRKPLYSLAKFIQDRQQWLDGARMRVSSSQPTLTTYTVQHAHSGQVGDTKRRRKTPPSTPPDTTGNSSPSTSPDTTAEFVTTENLSTAKPLSTDCTATSFAAIAASAAAMTTKK